MFQFNSQQDRWPFVSLVSGVAAMAVALVVLYAPGGLWKFAVGIGVIVTIFMLGSNPQRRMLAIGTAAALTGIGGLAATFLFSAEISLPGGRTASGLLTLSSDAAPWVFLALTIVGLVAVGWDIKRWDGFSDSNPIVDVSEAPDQLILVPHKDGATIGTADNNGLRRFSIELSLSLSSEEAMRIVNVELEGADDVEFGISDGDGVHTETTINSMSGCDLVVSGTFNENDVPNGPFERELIVVNDQAIRYGPISISFRPAP